MDRCAGIRTWDTASAAKCATPVLYLKIFFFFWQIHKALSSFLKVDLFPHTTSQDSCWSLRIDTVMWTWKNVFSQPNGFDKKRAQFARSNNCTKMNYYILLLLMQKKKKNAELGTRQFRPQCLDEAATPNIGVLQ